MKQFVKSWSVGLVLLSLLAFNGKDGYRDSIDKWHRGRIEDLKSEEGWLNLAGLFWLEEGENTFGGSVENDLVFPEAHSHKTLGKMILKNGIVTLEASPEAGIFNGTQLVEKIELFPYNQPLVLSHQSLRWFIIKRGNKYAVRLRDLESPALKTFKGIERYPVRDAWRIKAKFEPGEGKTIAITDVTGRTSEEKSPGSLVFTVKGQTYSLDAVGSKENLFLIFGDATNQKHTYGAGRFVYVSPVDQDGYCWLDFNMATNPPCAFTPFATCPLPPKQNKLTLAITAGEKRFGDH